MPVTVASINTFEPPAPLELLSLAVDGSFFPLKFLPVAIFSFFYALSANIASIRLLCSENSVACAWPSNPSMPLLLTLLERFDMSVF